MLLFRHCERVDFIASSSGQYFQPLFFQSGTRRGPRVTFDADHCEYFAHQWPEPWRIGQIGAAPGERHVASKNEMSRQVRVGVFRPAIHTLRNAAEIGVAGCHRPGSAGRGDSWFSGVAAVAVSTKRLKRGTMKGIDVFGKSLSELGELVKFLAGVAPSPRLEIRDLRRWPR